MSPIVGGGIPTTHPPLPRPHPSANVWHWGGSERGGWKLRALSCVLSALFSLPLVITGWQQLCAPLLPHCCPIGTGGGGGGVLICLMLGRGGGLDVGCGGGGISAPWDGRCGHCPIGGFSSSFLPPLVPSTTGSAPRPTTSGAVLMCNLQRQNKPITPPYSLTPPTTPFPPGPSL